MAEQAKARRAAGVGTPPALRVERGREGEAIAYAYLQTLDAWSILGRNVYFRAGELDVIATDGVELVFVEVRSRWTTRGPRAEDSVTRTKQRRLTRAALMWLQRNPAFSRHRARFDVLSVDLRIGQVVAHYRGAFEAEG